MPRRVKENAFLYFQVLLDAFCVLAATYLGLCLRFARILPIEYVFREYTGAVTFSVLVFLLVFYLMDMYGGSFRSSRSWHLFKIAIGAMASQIVLGLIFFTFRHWGFGRGLYLLQFMFFIPMDFVGRQFLVPYLVRAVPQQRVILFGSGSQMKTLVESSIEQNPRPFEVVGGYSRGGLGFDGFPANVSTVESFHRLGTICAARGTDFIIVDSDIKLDPGEIGCLIECKRYGITVLSMPEFYTRLFGKIPIEHVDMEYFIYGSSLHGNLARMRVNFVRLFDLASAALGLVLAAPIILIAAAAIKATSRGPVFYLQDRVGLNGTVYRIIKFRTMVQDAEKDSGPQWAAKNDARVTFVGKVLRRTRIDEIPQLFNVLVGDMSMIGPRPERPYFVEELVKEIPYYSLRLLVKPGITGWAQVRYRYGATVEDAREKLKYDLYFIREATLFDFVKILFKTAQTIFSKSGS